MLSVTVCMARTFGDDMHRHTASQKVSNVGVAQAMKSDLRNFCSGHFAGECLGEWAGCISLPSQVGKTRSNLPQPSFRQCSACALRCDLSACTRVSGSAMVRRLRSVLGSLTETLSLRSSTTCAICSVDLSKSTSHQRRPRTSPRLMPVRQASAGSFGMAATQRVFCWRV